MVCLLSLLSTCVQLEHKLIFHYSGNCTQVGHNFVVLILPNLGRISKDSLLLFCDKRSGVFPKTKKSQIMIPDEISLARVHVRTEVNPPNFFT